ncbi:MAG: hypothetical protein QOI50_6565, partial [Pseudonocardiales bacterium]|nr:hypothetical protein [Pseudonocardiales bacterium]
RFSSYAYGAVFAEVSVDEMLGMARIRRIFAASAARSRRRTRSASRDWPSS